MINVSTRTMRAAGAILFFLIFMVFGYATYAEAGGFDVRVSPRVGALTKVHDFEASDDGRKTTYFQTKSSGKLKFKDVRSVYFEEHYIDGHSRARVTYTDGSKDTVLIKIEKLSGKTNFGPWFGSTDKCDEINFE